MEIDNVKKYRLIIVILVLVNLVLVLIWWMFFIKGSVNDHNDADRKRWRSNRTDFFEQTLGLDEQQKVEFKRLNEIHFSRLKISNFEIDSLKSELQRTIVNDAGNETRLSELFHEIAVKRTSLDTSIYFHFKRLRALCRPEQVAVFDSLANSFVKKRGKMSPQDMPPPRREGGD